MPDKKEKQAKKRQNAVPAFESDSDVLGSYTGTPKDGGKPVQDADDL